MNEFETAVMFACTFFVGIVIYHIVKAYNEVPKETMRAYDFRSPEAAANFYGRLSLEELQAVEALELIDKDSIWGIAIQKVIESHSVEQFRAMVQDLKSQNKDNALVMECILGKAYDKVMTL